MAIINFIGEWINKNPGKATGAFLGFFLGIILFTFGFLKTIIIVLLILIGYFIGKSRDEHISLINQILNIFRKKDNGQIG